MSIQGAPFGKRPMIYLDSLTDHDLLRLYSQVLATLRTRGVVRSSNSPVADYAEWLVCSALGLEQAPPSEKGYDAEAPDGSRYEIKARRYAEKSRPSHFSVLRGLQGEHFDHFVCVLFEEDFSIRRALVLPREVVVEIAVYRRHVNGHVVTVRAALSQVDKGQDITEELQEARRVG